MKQNEAVYLEWIDSHSPNVSGWIHEDEVNTDLLRVKTLGWVLQYGNSTITVYNQKTEDGQLSGVITIPKAAIQEMRTISDMRS